MCKKSILQLSPQFQRDLPTISNQFDYLINLSGTVYRELENRKTIKFTLANKNYFIKQHFGIGWKEIFKNLLQGRLAIIGAKNEWLALQRLAKLQIPTMKVIGYGKRGINPAKQQSFLITEALEDMESLEDFCKYWGSSPPAYTIKQAIISQVANIARTIHQNGMNHRDFYICHFLLDKNLLASQQVKLYLIDLHRCQIRSQTPRRWIIKDIAGLYFSSRDIGLTQRDILRFLSIYFNKPWRLILKDHRALLRVIETRAAKLYFKTFNRKINSYFS